MFNPYRIIRRWDGGILSTGAFYVMAWSFMFLGLTPIGISFVWWCGGKFSLYILYYDLISWTLFGVICCLVIIWDYYAHKRLGITPVQDKDE